MFNQRFLLILAIILFGSLTTFAQRYRTAAGIRIDDGLQLTAQQYITNGWTLEGILHTSIMSDDLGLTVLGEKHHKILFRGFNFYTGAGMHYYGVNAARGMDTQPYNNVFGVSGIVGAELSLGRLNLSVDFKPELHLSGNQVRPFDWNGAAISARYIFIKRERKKLRDLDIFDKIGGKKNKKKKLF